MASLPPRNSGTPNSGTTASSQSRLLHGKPAVRPVPVEADSAATKQATDWLEMRRAAGWEPLEANKPAK